MLEEFSGWREKAQRRTFLIFSGKLVSPHFPLPALNSPWLSPSKPAFSSEHHMRKYSLLSISPQLAALIWVLKETNVINLIHYMLCVTLRAPQISCPKS